MSKQNNLNTILVTLGVLTPFLVDLGYLLTFFDRPLQILLAYLLLYGAGPIGCIAFLTVLIINRKKLNLFGWLVLLLFLSLDFFMITPINKYVILKIQNKPELIIFSGKRQEQGTIYQMSRNDWRSLESLKKSTVLRFISADISDAGITRLEGNPYIRSVYFENCPNITDKVIQPLSKVPHLKIIYFIGIPQLKEPDFSDFANLKRLHCLEFMHCENLAGKSLESIPHLPRLKVILLRGCPFVTKDSMIRFSQNNPQCKITQ